jgi:hypothetical protein
MATRRVVAAGTHLQAYSPEPPFGETAAIKLRSFQHVLEEARAAVDSTRIEMLAHQRTHSLTNPN